MKTFYHVGAVLNGLLSVESPVLSGDALTHHSGVFVYEDSRGRIRREGARLSQRTETLAWRKSFRAAAVWAAASFWRQRSDEPCDLPGHDCLVLLPLLDSLRSGFNVWKPKLCERRNRKWIAKEMSARLVCSKNQPIKSRQNRLLLCKATLVWNFSPYPFFFRLWTLFLIIY